MHLDRLTDAIILIAAANGAPVIATWLLGQIASRPIDWGLNWYDGRPILGATKTIRGIICALAATVIGALVLNLDWAIGLVVGAAAMGGDLLSSFIKRRLGLEASARATGLDQIPESVIPALVCMRYLDLGWLDFLAATCIFFVGELIFSKLLYHLHIRKRPY
jgi:CDP-diglyceride synthetase